MKPVLVASVLGAFLLSSAAVAAPFNGPYAGAAVGYESLHNDFNNTGLGAFAGLNYQADLSATGPVGGIFAGYGKTFDRLYLGAEVEGNLANANGKNSITATGFGTIFGEVKHKYDYGVSIRPGFMLTDSTLLYGRVGVIRSRFDDKATNTNVDLTGLRLGVGAEVALNQVLTGRLDYVYTDYKTDTYTDASQSARSSATSSTVKVGVAFNF